MTARSIEDYRANREDAPLDLVRNSEAWKPVVHLINGWAKEKLGPKSGYSPKELDNFAWRQGVRFPVLLREWWRLAGHHSFVKPGLLSDNAMFLAPYHRGWGLHRDFFAITIDDVQTQTCNGIHFDFISEADPEIHGMNGTIEPEDAPTLNWYRGQFIATELRVPSLIFITLLYHLFQPSPLVCDSAVYLTIERHGLLGGDPDARLVSSLRLKRFQNETYVGDVYSNGEDIVYHWLRGCVCRTADAAERVCWAVPAKPRSNGLP
jgi:hypothetical protein